MPEPGGSEPGGGRPAVRAAVSRAVRGTVDALERLGGGLGTALLAAGALALVLAAGVLCLVGVGLLVLPAALRAVRSVANRERRRLTRWGPEVVSPYPVPPAGLRATLADPSTRRDLGWLVLHATGGTLLGFVGVLLPILAVRDASFLLWWSFVPPDAAGPSLNVVQVHSWLGATAVSLLGVGWLAIAVGLGPGMARLQARPGRILLRPYPGFDLSLRIAELSATRAAALDAHAAELRRIERSLHDGTQNRIVGVTVLLGAARRALARDPSTVDGLLDRAQDAAEQALAELRAVTRSILPPVLDARGLEDAVAALAADCPVPCAVTVDVPGRCAVSVEATAYFVVAEAVTNIAKHSGAGRAEVTVRRTGDRLRLRVSDDGKGGAEPAAGGPGPYHGSGLGGIRRRVEALDGTCALTSPPGGPTILDVDLPCGS
jgi:signal transduction histidine kinase